MNDQNRELEHSLGKGEGSSAHLAGTRKAYLPPRVRSLGQVARVTLDSTGLARRKPQG